MNEQFPGTGENLVFINNFTLKASPEEFERSFAETAEFMARQHGFVGHWLVRHSDDANKYANIAVWTGEEEFRRALAQPGFEAHALAIRELATSSSGLYTPRQSRTVEPGSAGSALDDAALTDHSGGAG
ncbi:antibiotic biosynthesis monooxygenase family protein [Nocardiopsis dassonvillei]|uniref:antibiotic biosynthesis monooxygenase family protein n=1 Tax=Nocardiopsis dassonvillei TaxID=2014 RepID=UPI00362C57B0